MDRSSRHPQLTELNARIDPTSGVERRARNRFGAAHIGHDLGLAPSTVQLILNQDGVGRLDRGDWADRMVGMHRVARALIEDRQTLRAVRFNASPAPDFTNRKPEELPY